MEAPKFDIKIPEEGRRMHEPKHCEYNYKDEYNIPNILNDKNKSSAFFIKLIYIHTHTHTHTHIYWERLA